MLLRPRQKELVDKTVNALNAHGNTLAVAPTGAGKTIMLSAVIGRMMDEDLENICVLAHRDELTDQNADKFSRVNPNISTSIFNSNEKSWDGSVTFAMVQTLSRKNNLTKMPVLDMLVIDEAHHARAKSYMRVIEHARSLNPSLKLLGVTATPNRGDKKGLRPIFSNVADQITVKELIISGHLVPPRTFVVDVGVEEELNKVRKNDVDYDMVAVASIMNTHPINDEVVRHWQEKAEDRQTAIFCSTVDHARDVTDSFESAGVSAAMIWGDMNDADRQDTLAAYSRGEVRVIVNVAVLNEGWDHPPTSCIVLLRPSSYKSAMIQMIGRGLRIVNPTEFPGIVKKDCIVLDFGISTRMHGSLEQEVKLDDQRKKKKSDYKNCPECDAEVPVGTKECPLCGYVWNIQDGQQDSESTQIDDFEMTEIDIIEQSNFHWCDLRDDDRYFIAAAFDTWGGVFFKDDEWYAVGGRKDKGQPRVVELLAAGERVVCFAAADDWLNLFVPPWSPAYKTHSWLNEPPTEKQLTHLPDEYRNDHNLTRYKASALITMTFNQHNIIRAIASGRSPND